MIHDTKHLMYKAVSNDEMYWERVNRSLGWLGDTEEEQHKRQEKLKNAVIGIAGTGGIDGIEFDLKDGKIMLEGVNKA